MSTHVKISWRRLLSASSFISSALETLKLNSVDDTPSDDVLPNAHSLWTKTETE